MDGGDRPREDRTRRWRAGPTQGVDNVLASGDLPWPARMPFPATRVRGMPACPRLPFVRNWTDRGGEGGRAREGSRGRASARVGRRACRRERCRPMRGWGGWGGVVWGVSVRWTRVVVVLAVAGVVALWPRTDGQHQQSSLPSAPSGQPVASLPASPARVPRPRVPLLPSPRGGGGPRWRPARPPGPAMPALASGPLRSPACAPRASGTAPPLTWARPWPVVPRW